VRVSRACMRWLLYALAIAGVAASVRNAIAPPAPRIVAAVSGPTLPDAAGQWFALQFTRAYLTWTTDPALRDRALGSFFGAEQSNDAGAVSAPGGVETVRTVAIADERTGAAGEHDYTVAATTGTGAMRYLAVAVARRTGGGERLARYPALVAAPTPLAASSLDGAGLPALSVSALTAVLDRALGNYIAGSAENLAADLAPGARVAPVAPGLSLTAVERLAVEPAGDVLATVEVDDSHRDTFTLAYQISVAQLGGRWEITDIEP